MQPVHQEHFTQTIQSISPNTVTPSTLPQPTVKSLPPLPKTIPDMRDLYRTWASEFKPTYDEHYKENNCYKWKKIFGDNGSAMNKRHHCMKDWLQFIHDNPDQQETLFKLFEDFATENKLSHSVIVKKCFYGALRPNTSYYTDPAYNQHIQTLAKKLTDAGFQLPELN